MQLQLAQGNKSLPLVVPLLFYHHSPTPAIPVRTGLITLTIRRWLKMPLTKE
ncbi:Rpn family recombination-promoting nuclease/putative transposase [Brenneria izbisi]|uniref:Rpn family recombination-promoting nuclease/putative transposase n=1 Tax=Brenneria izbisi TaxID=2939450 RepID=A0AA41XWV8_9GAMM|nr:Rpn family recombination-promoting nuclease/putative transposase [Brenneria izbisi]MCV9878006.1 Rpn family recombination-promoting nuclease/putative transposase [Brenneria izbisi]MCV9881430.1 Rpn family recombination-promoting nuclease/putative transposase [Brenneria izbisi]